MGRGDRKLKRGAWGEGKRKRAGDFFLPFSLKEPLRKKEAAHCKSAFKSEFSKAILHRLPTSFIVNRLIS